MTLREKLYCEAVAEPSDISDHLIVLRNLANRNDVKSIAEFGVRKGFSTRALLAGAHGTMISVDADAIDPVLASRLRDAALEANVNFTFVQSDSLKFQCPDVDLLFLDTYHTYEFMWLELYHHGRHAQRYIAIHDTELFAHRGEDEKPIGILDAINHFLVVHPEWKIRYSSKDSCGLVVMEKVR